MGVLADLLSNATGVDTTVPHEASDRVFCRKIQGIIDQRGDRDYPSGTDTAADEVQTIAQFGGSPSAGDFTLTFDLFGSVSFTTDAIAFDADAATIEAAIDAAAAAVVQGWTNGDIAVTGGSLDAAGITLTFSGASVTHKNHGQTTIDATGVTGGTAGAAATTTDGKPVRRALASLYALGLLSGSVPSHGSTTVTAALARGNFPIDLDGDTVRTLVKLVEIEEGTSGIEAAILAALGY